jgi:hypothetical protein
VEKHEEEEGSAEQYKRKEGKGTRSKTRIRET